MGDIKGMSGFYRRNEEAKIKISEEKERQGRMKLRKTGEHLYKNWDPSTKFCEPFKFENIEARKLDARAAKKKVEEAEKIQAQEASNKEHEAKLRQKANLTGSKARAQDYLAKQLNTHRGPPLLVLELTNALGEINRLSIWEDDNLEQITQVYANANELSEEGKRELFAVLVQNVNALYASNEQRNKMNVEEYDSPIISDTEETETGSEISESISGSNFNNVDPGAQPGMLSESELDKVGHEQGNNYTDDVDIDDVVKFKLSNDGTEDGEGDFAVAEESTPALTVDEL